MSHSTTIDLAEAYAMHYAGSDSQSPCGPLPATKSMLQKGAHKRSFQLLPLVFLR